MPIISKGRPPRTDVIPVLLNAAYKLVKEQGYCSITIEMIAREAGVSRQTVYRRWGTKADLILDALITKTGEMTVIAKGSAAEKMLDCLSKIIVGLESGDRDILSGLIAAAQEDQAFKTHYYINFVKARVQILKDIFLEGIDNNEISPRFDIDLALETVYGTLWYRILLGLPLDISDAERLTNFVMSRSTQ